MSSMQSAAIAYHPEGYSTRGPTLMGRHSAGESFLRGFFRHGRAGEALYAQVLTREHGEEFAQLARLHGRREPVHLISPGHLATLSEAGAVYLPGPELDEAAWRRAVSSPGGDATAWSLCGITHTTASAAAMDAITGMLTAPVQPWDALICTSRAVLANVQQLLQAQEEYLRSRFGASRIVMPMTPVIPLGVHADDFVFTPSERAAARAAIGADESTVVVLFVGRLSFHGKAHPLPMYQALESAARALPPGRRLMLVECGWHGNDAIAQAFGDAAALICPSVGTRTLDGRQPEARRQAWAAADVFCSLADNIQETFGLTPLEALAAGLPVVVSDWNGYRDTVRHGIDGLRVPTWAPPPGTAADLSRDHAMGVISYDYLCGYTSSLVAVDTAEAAAALSALVLDPVLRRRLGDAGRQRARATFDWAAVIPQYEALWAEQAARRSSARAAGSAPALKHPWPARMEAFSAFAGYPSAWVGTGTRLALAAPTAAQAIEQMHRLRQLRMVGFAEVRLPALTHAQSYLELLEASPASAEELAARLRERGAEADADAVHRMLLWLLKLGVLRCTGKATVRD